MGLRDDPMGKLDVFTEKDAREAALADAAGHIPNPDDPDEIPSFARKVVQVQGQMQDRLVRDYVGEINPLDAKVCEYERVLKDKRTKRLMDWEGRFSSHIRNPFWYWTALLIVFTADVAINSYVFQSWGDTNDMSLYIAVVVGVAFLLAAKFSAWSLRSGPSLAARLVGAGTLLVPLIVLWLISANRYSAMSAEGRTVGNSLALYYGLNILFFGVGVLLSFFHETRLERLARSLDEVRQMREKVFETYASRALHNVHVSATLLTEYRETNDREQGRVGKWRDPVMVFPRVLTELHPADGGAQNVTAVVQVDSQGQPATAEA